MKYLGLMNVLIALFALGSHVYPSGGYGPTPPERVRGVLMPYYTGSFNKA